MTRAYIKDNCSTIYSRYLDASHSEDLPMNDNLRQNPSLASKPWGQKIPKSFGFDGSKYNPNTS